MKATGGLNHDGKYVQIRINDEFICDTGYTPHKQKRIANIINAVNGCFEVMGRLCSVSSDKHHSQNHPGPWIECDGGECKYDREMIERIGRSCK